MKRLCKDIQTSGGAKATSVEMQDDGNRRNSRGRFVLLDSEGQSISAFDIYQYRLDGHQSINICR